jgi:hypothetical protein
MSTEEIVRFLDEFRRNYGGTDEQGARKLEIPTPPDTVGIIRNRPGKLPQPGNINSQGLSC